MNNTRNEEIYDRYKRGETHASAAKKYGISRTRVKQIVASMDQKLNYGRSLEVDQDKPMAKIEQLIYEGIKDNKIDTRTGTVILRYIRQNQTLSGDKFLEIIKKGPPKSICQLGEKRRRNLVAFFENYQVSERS